MSSGRWGLRDVTGGVNKSSSGRVVHYSCPRAGSLKRWSHPRGPARINRRGDIVSNPTFVRLRPILRVLTRGTRSARHRVQPCDLPAVQTLSTPLDRGSIVPLCAVCIEAGRATEATYQTRDLLCGCDAHIQQLEQHGRAAIRRLRSPEPDGYIDRGAPPVRETNGDRPADLPDQGAGLCDGSAGPNDDRVGGRTAYRS